MAEDTADITQADKKFDRRDFFKIVGRWIAVSVGGAVTGSTVGKTLESLIGPPQPLDEPFHSIINPSGAAATYDAQAEASIQATQTSPDYNLRQSIEALPAGCADSSVQLQLDNGKYRLSSTATIVAAQQTEDGKLVIIGFTAKHCLENTELPNPNLLIISQPHRPQVPSLTYTSENFAFATHPQTDFGIFALKAIPPFPIQPIGLDHVLPNSQPPPKEETFYGLSFPIVNGKFTIFPIDFNFYLNKLGKPAVQPGKEFASVTENAPGASGTGAFSANGRLSFIFNEEIYSDANYIPIPSTYPDLIQQAISNLEKRSLLPP